MLNVTNLSTLNIAFCLYTNRRCLSFIRLRPSHNFLFLNNQTHCLRTLSWQKPVLTFLPAPDTKQM